MAATLSDIEQLIRKILERVMSEEIKGWKMGLERFSAKIAAQAGAIVFDKDGHQYEYIAGPDRKGGVVLFIHSFDYYKILWDNQIAGVKLPPIAAPEPSASVGMEPVAWVDKQGLEHLSDFDTIYKRGGFDNAVPLYSADQLATLQAKLEQAEKSAEKQGAVNQSVVALQAAIEARDVELIRLNKLCEFTNSQCLDAELKMEQAEKEMLRLDAGWGEANVAKLLVGLQLEQAEKDRAELLEALKFYADGNHFVRHNPLVWDTVSGEPENFQEDEANTATVEDGSLAKAIVAKYEVKK